MDRRTSSLRSNLAQWYGRLEFYCRPGLLRRRGGPFNGQVLRQACYGELLRKFQFQAIIETGSYRGITTSLFAQAQIPVFSIETNPRFAAYSATRLKSQTQVSILQGDSRTRLLELADDDRVPKENVFFYLDAHWFDDLPLAEEIDIITEHWRDWVIMVDDFEVPDTAYAYDAYGPGKNLEATYLQRFVEQGVELFYPSYPAEQETGARRGCVVLALSGQSAERLEECLHLRRNSSVNVLQVA